MRGNLALLGMLAWPAVVVAQASMPQALQYERRGNYPAAAETFRAVLAESPSEVSALLGLERVLGQLGQPDRILPEVRRALAADSGNVAAFGIGVRAWSAAGQPDSARELVERWAQVEPGDEGPWREWGYAALAVRDRETAQRAYRTGRERLGEPALAGELAQLATLDGDLPTAIREWLLSVRAQSGYRASALSLLGQLPPDRRAAALARLELEDDPVAARLGSGLAARWGEPLRGFQILEHRLPPGEAGAGPLSEFLDDIRGQAGPEAAAARGRALELLAYRSGREVARWLAEAGRAYADAGDQQSARRVLARLAAEPSAAQDVAASAAVTLVGVLIREGALEEAETRLADLEGVVGVEDRERLQQGLARGWLRAGDPERAERTIVGDSSVAGLALGGRIRLALGDLRGATDGLAQGGPFGDDRADATERAALLALLQVLEPDSLPELGAAYLLMEAGDTAAAAKAMAELGARHPPGAGGGDLLLWAGRMFAQVGQLAEAEPLFRASAAAGRPAARAIACYELAGLMSRDGRDRESIGLLEQLILDFPDSSVAPQARRLLDAVRGGVPGGGREGSR